MKRKYLYIFIILLIIISMMYFTHMEYEGNYMSYEEFSATVMQINGIGEQRAELLYDKIVIENNMVKKTSPLIPIIKDVLNVLFAIIVVSIINQTTVRDGKRTRSSIRGVEELILSDVEINEENK